METTNKILGIICETLQIPPHLVDEQSGVENIPNWDSLSHLQIVLELERIFEIRFQTAEIAKLTSVKQIKKIVTTHTS